MKLVGERFWLVENPQGAKPSPNNPATKGNPMTTQPRLFDTPAHEQTPEQRRFYAYTEIAYTIV
ncbi:hypothetical protein, partial [uncultured Thioclava sp.]|uniref:hypothetical protein n=1 Tax=uncultured Thioclava sp. TaxID=473858 RepID=UPI0025CEB0F4